MSMRFRDSVVWLTGSSSGIGEVTARCFHEEGAHVILSGRRKEALERIGESCAGQGQKLVLPFDVRDEAAIHAAKDIVFERFGRVDILFSNAGVAQRARVEEADVSVYRTIMEVNFFGPLALTKAVLPSMLERGQGHIVCTTSVAGK
jgi:NADP-dependent 3-hydroxy acid dehydrogenase YdfG